MGGGRNDRRVVSSAKISRPSITGVAPRERLFDMLDTHRGRPVTWISGPAGSGKTTLIASYLDARKLPCLWYQVDAGDADVSTFFYYMGLAAGNAVPGKRTPLPLLTPEYLSGLSTFTRRYFEYLCARLTSPFVIVFDNYQDVPEDSVFHEVMREGLGVVPKGVRVISLSRSGIPAALARLHANGAISALGWDAIRFTADETRDISRSRGMERLSDETLRNMHEKTEGWAAGLVLMIEALKAAGGASAPPAGLAPQNIFDYFGGEIFAKTDAEMREFLLKTAFLPKISVPIARDLTGNARSEQILSSLNKNHYFTERLAHDEPLYQYHPLFRDFLLARAKSAYSEEASRIRIKAASLLEEAGEVEDAAELFWHAEDWQSLIRLILNHGRSLVVQGRGRTLEKWLNGIPGEITTQTPWLLYWLGVCRMPFDLRESRLRFEHAYGLFREKKDVAGLYLSWSGIVETFVYEWSDFTPLDRWIAELETLLQEHPAFPSPEIEARVSSGVFCALMYRQPHHPDLPFWEERVSRIIFGGGDVNLKMAVSSHLIFYYTWWSGEQAKAAMLVNTLRSAVRSPGISPLSSIVWKAIEAAWCWMTADNEGCFAAVNEGLDIANKTGIRLWDFMLAAQASFGALTAGDLEKAGTYLRGMSFISQTNRRLDIAMYHSHLAWEALWRSGFSLARENMNVAVHAAADAGVPFFHAFCLLGLADALIELGEYAEAEKHLEEARQTGVRMKSNTLQYQYFWIETVRRRGEGDGDGALRSLREHLAVARKNGILNHVFWRTPVMLRLYAMALDAGIETGHVQHVIRKRNLVPDEPPIGTPNWPWPLKLYALGRFEIEKDGELLTFEGRAPQKPLSLLKMLIASGAEGASELQVSDALWLDADGDAAHSVFTTTLQRLRKLIGEQAIRLQAGRLSIDPRYCWVDAWAFERLLERTGGNKEGASVEATIKALDMYRGDYLPGDETESWAAPYRENLRIRFHRCIRRLAAAYERKGKWKEALDAYQRGLAINDLVEEFYQGVMACCMKLGLRAEGITAYNRCKAALMTKLGVNPSAATEALYKSLVSE